MKLLCIYEGSDGAFFIKKDKEYTVVAYNDKSIKIINDKGLLMNYPHDWFENTEQEIRNDKLEKLFKKLQIN